MAPRGRYNKGRGRGRGRGGGGGGHRPYQDNRVSFENVPKQNEKFERFYNTLNIVPAGRDRDAFWSTLRRELPNSFRFTGSKGHALSVRKNLVDRFFPIISQIKHEGRPVEIPKPMLWYPEGLAYTMRTPKNVVRKYEPFKEFQKFLVSETGVGNISRQEHVSMIPPLLLDIKPEHTVLDLCAAPGSKSAQLIEAIHAGEEERVGQAVQAAKSFTNDLDISGTHVEDSGRATGLLIANDVNYQRAQMLVHQVKRLNSPNLIVTNHDATMFPSIALSTPPGEQKKNKYLKFDRILADVPCSGDGTCRKNPGIWKEWNPQNGLGLYITQVKILTRSLQMLKVGGRVVYSTCSMNPTENEAVVSSAIERCGGIAKVKLIDCSSELPDLIRNQGLTDWSVMSRNGEIYESFAEALQYESSDSKLVPGMFPPESEEEHPLQHCMRVYPHQQDTGGFFIAVLEKLSEIRAKPEDESKCMKKDWTFSAPPSEEARKAELAEKMTIGQLLKEASQPDRPTHSDGDLSSAAANQNDSVDVSIDGSPNAGSKRKASDAEDTVLENDNATKKARVDDVVNGASPGGLQPPPRKRNRDNQLANEEAFKYLSPGHPELATIFRFYELRSSFPRDRFLVRNPAGDPVKGIYYTSQLAKDILTSNEGRGMKFVHAGVKMFMKQDSQGQDICRWRIQTEGLPIIEGWVGEDRVVKLRKKSTLRKLLVEMFPKLKEADLGEIGEQVYNMGMGCCVLRVEISGDEDGFEEALTLPLWRSMHSVNLMLPKEDRKAMLLRIFEEDIELINHSDPKQSKAGAEKKEMNGSIPAEEEAKAVQEKMENISSEDEEEGGVALAPEVADGDALQAEDDALVQEDRAKAAKMEVEEDEQTKVENAMPERWGEDDVMNKTV